MTFDEIDGLDGDKPTWIVPKERMKMGREHRVPLGDAAVAILRDNSQRAGLKAGRTRSCSPRPCRANRSATWRWR